MIAVYARQSVERENSVSIETQVDFCKSCIKPNERDIPVKVYIDEGASGGNTNRPGFQQMMQDIAQGRLEKVIVYKLDRMSRSLCDFVGILQNLKKHHVEFISSQEAFDTSTIYGDLVLKILMVFSEFERMSIINRVRDAYSKRSDLGLYMGGRRQYGFQLQETTLHHIPTKIYIPVPEETAQVQEIYTYYAQEQVSLRMLQEHLISRGMQPADGSTWTTAKLSALIKNPVYVSADYDIYSYYHAHGARTVDDISAFDGSRAAFLFGKTTHDRTLPDWSDMKIVLAQHAGIVCSALWLACQNKLEKNKQIGNSVSNKTSWLGGLVSCAKCGYTMTAKRSRKKRYFSCTGKSNKKICTGVHCPLFVDDLETYIDQMILQRLSALKTVRWSTTTPSPHLNRLKLKLAEVRQQEKALIEPLMQEACSAPLIHIMNQTAAELKREKKRLCEAIDALQLSEQKAPLDLSNCWKEAGFYEKKACANIMIHKILFYEDGSSEIIWNA